MKRYLLVALLAGTFGASAAQADERYFGYVYSAEPMPKGETEAELWITDRRGRQVGVPG